MEPKIVKEEKKIVIDLAKEEEEDKELIELLEGKKRKISSNNNFVKSFKNENNIINKELNIYDLNLKESIYRKIDNYCSNRNFNNMNHNNNHNSQVNKKREKNRIIILNKQKNVSANTMSKNSHVGRLLNLRKIKSQNNLDYNKNKSEKLRDDFCSIGEKFIPYTGKQVLCNKKYNIQNNINSNDDTPSVSTLAHTKKYTSNSINTQNLTEDHNNKYRVNLLSAFSSNSNNNIFIPFFPVQRPVSNFNTGSQLKMENFNSEKIINNEKQMNMTKKHVEKIEKIKVDKSERQKISTAPLKKRPKKNYSNLFSSINFFGQKFHHIKIDKSLMNNKLGKNMILNYMNLGQNRFPKIKSNNQYNEIKKLFNIRNNSTKN